MKKIFLMLIAITTVSFSNVNLEVKTSYKENREGFIYENIEKLDYEEEKVEKEYNLIDLKMNYKNLQLDFNLKGDNLSERYIPKLKTKLSTNKILNTNLAYSFEYIAEDDKLQEIRANNMRNTLSLVHNNASLEFGNSILNSKINDIFFKGKLENENGSILLEVSKNLDSEKYLRTVRNKQVEIREINDGHDHFEKLSIFDNLDYDINEVEKNYEGKYNFDNLKSKIELEAKYRLEGYKIGINSSYEYEKYSSNLADKIVFDLVNQKLNAKVDLKTSLTKNLELGFNSKLKVLDVNQEVEKKEAPVKGKNYEMEIIGSNIIKGVNEKEISLGAALYYEYIPIKDLSVLFSLNIDAYLKSKYEKIYDDAFELRKKAYDLEIKNVEKVRAGLSEDEIKAIEEEIKNLEISINEKNINLEEKAKEIDYSRTNISRSDKETLIEEYKKIIENKTIAEIKTLFSEKVEELKKFEKENFANFKEVREYTSVYQRNDIKEDRYNKILEKAISSSKENPEKFARDYVELLEFKNGGVIYAAYTLLNNTISALERELKKDIRDREAKLKTIYPDPMVVKFYEDLVDKKKNQYTLGTRINPSISTIYKLNNNLEIRSLLNLEIDINKNISKNTKINNHIHFSPSIEIKYVF